MIDNLSVVLVRPRFPENIGMVARACANMGCKRLILVKPERWDKSKALPLATARGIPILETIAIYSDLSDALASFQLIVGTTARLGGWRREILTPQQAAAEILTAVKSNRAAALLFGPEDAGLSNTEIAACHGLANIPTAGASSLNLAQACLIMLYECLKYSRGAGPVSHQPRTVSHAEQSRLENNLKDVLLKLDCLHGQNPDYFFTQWQQLLRRAALRPHEYDCLMGFCRQLRNKL